ncbi:MAG: efflux RND transporter permease subunit, partial [Proteiniphilum sp.]|nr:efflux RND transporter permease subunit [Proteiniphilum sp.]
MDFLLNKRVTISMLFIATTLLGYVSYKQLPVELLPNAELPMLVVSVNSQQDMDPAFVESEVIIPLEGAISSVGGVDKIQSEISSRQSSIRIDFKSNVNFKTTSLRLEEKMKEVSASLPAGFNVRVQKMDVSMVSNTFI